MTLGLEGFLKELRAEEGVIALEFNFFESKITKVLELKLIVWVGDKFKKNTRHRLSYNFDTNPDPCEKKYPKSFTSTLKQIKKEIKNQPRS